MLENDSKDTFARSRRAATLIKLGESKSAEADLETLLNAPNENVADLYNRAIALILLGNYSKSVETLQQAIKLNSVARIYALQDDLFDPIRNFAEFQKLMKI